MARRHHYKRRTKGGAHEIDVTTFLNLMVVLVPFLLITAVFSRLTIVELNLPSSAGDEYDFQTLSDFMIELKREYPDHESASVLMEAQIPYDYLIQVMDIVRSVEVPVEDPLEGEPEYELYALFTEISVGDAP